MGCAENNFLGGLRTLSCNQTTMYVKQTVIRIGRDEVIVVNCQDMTLHHDDAVLLSSLIEKV